MSSSDRMDTSEVEVQSDERPGSSAAVAAQNKPKQSSEVDVNNIDEERVETEVEEKLEKIDVAADEAEDAVVDMAPKTPRRGRGAPKKITAASPRETAVTPGKAGRGRKRKPSVTESANTTVNSTFGEHKTPGRKVQKLQVLTYQQFAPSIVGDRVLSCGEGESLGHPGRTTTKKPRRVDIFEELNVKPIQVVAGGVHSAVLTDDGQVFMCGINEKGTVPAEGVEREGSTDEFAKVPFSEDLQKEGKIIMIAAGASFTAGLTDQGTVIAWGNLRNSNGNVDVHPLLHKMQEQPAVIVHHNKRKIVKIAAGENHLVMLDELGQILTFGDGEMGQLGRSVRTKTIRSKFMCDESGEHLVVPLRFRQKKFYDVNAKNVFASGFWTIVHGEDGKYYAFGLNNFGQLGIKVDEANNDNVGPDGQDNRELRVFLPAEAPAFGAEDTFTSIEGVQHVVVRTENGEVFTMGKNTDNALGLGNWQGKDDQQHWLYDSLQKLDIDGKKVAGVSAKLATSVVWTEDGEAYAWGFDTTGQLGLGLKDDDDKMVPTPEQITSAHLDGFSIIGASVSDQHTLILAKKSEK
ncbi:unnamed protein product [Caenorhabditis angaria]|uniref:RCC1-like domain-containing protein n=1 Tax=Caenorhabditis angaria TaxID=860376 RepID=A0A9P1MVD7_9PELO|nr:unnamed protein product [Caenorhabditis angaria]